jgi:hypothetical protein
LQKRFDTFLGDSNSDVRPTCQANQQVRKEKTSEGGATECGQLLQRTMQRLRKAYTDDLAQRNEYPQSEIHGLNQLA